MDGKSPEQSPEGIDLTRLVRPEVDAFRYIAASLGARFAGDIPALVPADASHPAATLIAHPAADEAVAPAQDPRAAALLEKLPIPVLVTGEEGIAFLNKAARSVLAYGSAERLDAAGGLGVLFRAGAADDGAILLEDANGTTLRARVQMMPVEWAGQRTMMMTLEPLDPPAQGQPARPASSSASAPLSMQDLTREQPDGLDSLLNANPDPMAIVGADGMVHAANAPYRVLCAAALGERSGDGLTPEALAAVNALIGEASQSAAMVPLARTLRIGGGDRVVSAGALGNALVCVVFHVTHPIVPAFADVVRTASPTPVETAVQQAQQLVGDAAIVLRLEGGGAGRLETERAGASERFFRAVLVALGARAPAGTVVTVRREGRRYAITLNVAAHGVLKAVTRSERLVLFGLDAGLAVAMDAHDALVIAPLVEDPQPAEV